MKKFSLFILMVFMFLSFGLALADDFSFSPVVSLETGASPRGISSGNVYGNGFSSLIVADFGSPTFIGQNTPATVLNPKNSVLQVFSPSANGLQLRSTIQTAASPRGVSSFNLGSGNQDDILVTAYDANLLQIFSWKGGQFVKADEQPTLNMPVGVSVGTTRKGGDLLAVVADYGANMISMYPIQSGRLGKRADMPVDSGPTQVAIGDLNGDGVNEIAVVCLSAGKIDILSQGPVVNQGGSSTYFLLKSIALPSGSAPSDLKIADLNGDGRMDLAAVDFSKNSLLVFIQQPDGTLVAEPALTTSGNHPNGLTVADLHRDGQKEIIVANRDSDTVDLFKMENGHFHLDQTLKTADEPVTSFGPIQVCALDTHGQGTLDLVTTHMRSNSIKILAQAAVAQASAVKAALYEGGAGMPFSDKSTYCYPNPSSGGNVKFTFTLDQPSAVGIVVFDMGGELVWNQRLNPAQTQSGVNVVNWAGVNQSGNGLASGIYIYQVTVGSKTVTKKLAILH